MCGLVGFIGAGSEHDLRFMVASLKHRGRDDEGLFFEKGLALGAADFLIKAEFDLNDIVGKIQGILNK